MGHEFFLSADLSKTWNIYHIYLIRTDAARSIETAINDLISYLSGPKFHVDTRVQVGDVLQDLIPIRNDVTHGHNSLLCRY
jgi:hypothetical protein